MKGQYREIIPWKSKYSLKIVDPPKGPPIAMLIAEGEVSCRYGERYPQSAKESGKEAFFPGYVSPVFPFLFSILSSFFCQTCGSCGWTFSTLSLAHSSIYSHQSIYRARSLFSFPKVFVSQGVKSQRVSKKVQWRLEMLQLTLKRSIFGEKELNKVAVIIGRLSK